MSITKEIFATWRRPAEVIQRKLAGATEGRALAILLGASVLVYVSRWPALSRQAHLERATAEASGTPLADVPTLEALLGINLFVILFVWPLLMYAIAGLSNVVLRICGVKLEGLSSRMALFWALLAASPLMLFHGMVSGFLGGMQANVVGLIVLVAFLWLWAALIKGAARA